MNFSDQKRNISLQRPIQVNKMITRTKCGHTCWGFTNWSAEKSQHKSRGIPQ